MDAEKRKLIVNEIHHWRRSKLLPEHYCDFLLNLYADEAGKTVSTGASLLRGGTSVSIRNSHPKVWLFGTLLAALISYFVFHFSSFPALMQIGISAIFILICYIVGITQRERRPILSYVGLGLGALSMLLIGMKLLEQYGLDDAGYIVGYLLLCSVTWAAIGWIVRNVLFSFCGWIGLILIYGWMLYGKLDEITWFTAQASWLPLAAVLGWIGWIVQHRSKPAGLVFLLLMLLVWFTPEIFMMYTNGYSDTVQFSITGKFLIAGVIAFVTRKRWTEWVA